jgi:hypothetical protein
MIAGYASAVHGGTDWRHFKERLPALVRDLFTFSSKVIKMFIIV